MKQAFQDKRHNFEEFLDDDTGLYNNTTEGKAQIEPVAYKIANLPPNIWPSRGVKNQTLVYACNGTMRNKSYEEI